jgi:hypothetical protein
MFMSGFFYGCAAMACLGVLACIAVGYMEARGKLRVPTHTADCGIKHRGCSPDCTFERRD